MSAIDETTIEGVEGTTKRKRRSSAEVQAEREAKALAKAQSLLANIPKENPLPPEREVSPLEAIAILAVNNIKPGEYSDIYDLMKDCIRVKRAYNLSDSKFMELMNRFDDRNVNEDKKGRK